MPLLTAEGANRLMAEIKPLAQRMCDDWREKTDWQHTDWAVLGPDAQDAAEAIDAACRAWEEEEDYLIAVHEVSGLEQGTYEITAATTDAAPLVTAEQLVQAEDEAVAHFAAPLIDEGFERGTTAERLQCAVDRVLERLD